MPAPNPLLSRPVAGGRWPVAAGRGRRVDAAAARGLAAGSRHPGGGHVGRHRGLLGLPGRRHAASTAAVRFKSLEQFYSWLTTEEWIETNPMARLRAPEPTEMPVPVLSDTELKALIGA